MPKVSVLMPVYNGEKYLAEAIDSVLNQSYQDWELIIINDRSTDKSEQIIQSYSDERIKYFENEVNLGLVKTLNKGIDFCTGKYIARMDADDISLSSRLSLQVDFLDRNSAYGMCGGNAEVINAEGSVTGSLKNLSENDLLKINLLFSVPFIHPCMMIRKEVLDEFRYDEAFKHVEDYDLWCRISRKWKVANLPVDLLKYRWHNSNVSVVHSSYQDDFKRVIVERELLCLGLNPTDEEFYAHQITFQLYSKGERLSISTIDFKAVSQWFSKLLKANSEKQLYNQYLLIAYLWSRWMVLCLSQKAYSKAVPSFASFHPKVLKSFIKLLSFLSKK